MQKERKIYQVKKCATEDLWRVGAILYFFKFGGSLITNIVNHKIWHCVKTARIRAYSYPYFPAFELNIERYSVSLRIQL